jgi:hypothetical protein
MFKRHCVVKYVDSFGVEHAAKVEAESLFKRSQTAARRNGWRAKRRSSLGAPGRGPTSEWPTMRELVAILPNTSAPGKSFLVPSSVSSLRARCALA